MCAENPTSNVFVVDTDKYSGNFEREMCAYITGQVGECGVGEETAEEASETIRNLAWFEENIVQEADEYQCHRPASIWPNPQTDGTNRPCYESVAIFLEVLPPQDVLDEMVERAKSYCEQKGLVFKGYRLLEPVFEMVPVVEKRLTGFKPA